MTRYRPIFFKPKRRRGVWFVVAVAAIAAGAWAFVPRELGVGEFVSAPTCHSSWARARFVDKLNDVFAQRTERPAIAGVEAAAASAGAANDGSRHCVAEVEMGVEVMNIRFRIVPERSGEAFALRLSDV